MGLFDQLEKILDIQFDADIDIANNISNISLIHYEGGKKLEKEGESLRVNINELTPEERQEFLDVPKEQIEVEGRVLEEDAENETAAIETGYEEDYDDILDYFEDIISESYCEVLEASLHLRALIDEKELDREEIYDRKRDIARKHTPDAYYLSSLVTAGYFDEDGGLRDLYVDLRLNKSHNNNFQEELERLVDERLPCVFVEEVDQPDEVTTDVKRRLKKFKEGDQLHDWLDIRGIGPRCEDIIDDVVDNLEDEFIGIDIEKWNADGRRIVRIRPHTIGSIDI